MTRRVRRLAMTPGASPVQLVLGLEGGQLAALRKRTKNRKYVPGGFSPVAKAKVA